MNHKPQVLIQTLSYVIFNNVFLHEETGYNSDENEIFQKQNINRKNPRMVFLPRPLILFIVLVVLEMG